MSEHSSPGTPPRRPPKSREAFRTISEVAGELDLPQHVLRFWESKFAQVKPLKRGGGRRYYRPEDVDLLCRIKALLYEEGYTIKGVQKLLRSRKGQTPDISDDADESDKWDAEIHSTSGASMAAGNGDELRQILDDLMHLRDLLRRHAGRGVVPGA